MTDIKTLGSFVWSIAETLRGDFKLISFVCALYLAMFPLHFENASVP